MNEKQRNASIVRTSVIGIIGNVILVAAKAVIGFLTGSSSIISDAINNLSDAMSSTVTIVGTKLSEKRPNKKHPFGYGRIEYITATVVAALIIFAGGSAIYESIVSLINGDKPTYDWVSFLVISLAIVAKLALGLYFRYRGKKLSSSALKNSGTDALFDALLSSATLVTALVSHFTQTVYLEGYAGILIGLFIFRSGIKAIIESLSPILGDRIDDALAHQIKAEICAHPDVLGAFDLIVHSYGEGKKIGSVHIEVADGLSAKDIYALEREIQRYMYQEHNIIMTVGIYASNDSDPLGKEMKTKIVDLVSKNPDIIQFHGFYFDKEREFVSFDLVFSFEAKQEPNVTIEEIKAKMEEDYPGLRFVVNLDEDYSA